MFFDRKKVAFFYSNKDPVLRNLQSHAIYQFECPGCKASYVGKTDIWKVRSGVEMRNIGNLVNHCVPLIGGSISSPFHDIASPNLVDRYYMSQKVISTNGCC